MLQCQSDDFTPAFHYTGLFSFPLTPLNDAITFDVLLYKLTFITSSSAGWHIHISSMSFCSLHTHSHKMCCDFFSLSTPKTSFWTIRMLKTRLWKWNELS